MQIDPMLLSAAIQHSFKVDAMSRCSLYDRHSIVHELYLLINTSSFGNLRYSKTT